LFSLLGLETSQDGCPGTYCGDKFVLYWADVYAEIAFIVPTPKSAKLLENETPDSSNVSGQGNLNRFLHWYELLTESD